MLAQCFLSGCAGVGPKSISATRTNYAEAIDQTENEQLLLMIVKGRYAETASLLAVNAVASNIKFRSEAGIETGFGPDSFRGDSLLEGKLAYEENPTITYSPVQGHKYVRQLESPIPLDLVLLTMRHPTLVSQSMTILINRANDLLNPHFILNSRESGGQGFTRFAELFVQLHVAGVLELIKNPDDDIVADVLIGDYSSKYVNEVNEFLTLLGLPLPQKDDELIIIPTYFGVNFGKPKGLAITTRTTLDLIEVLRATIQVPEEHLKAGLVLSYPPLGELGKGITIKVSKSRPENTSLRTFYRDYWYYVDGTDLTTKRFFNLLRILLSIAIDDSLDTRDMPLMTIPISQ